MSLSSLQKNSLITNPLYQECLARPTDILARQMLADDLMMKGQYDFGEYISDCIARNVHTESVFGPSWVPEIPFPRFIHWRYGLPSVIAIPPSNGNTFWWVGFAEQIRRTHPIGLIYCEDQIILPEQGLVFVMLDSHAAFVYQYNDHLIEWSSMFNVELEGTNVDFLRRHGNVRLAQYACAAAVRHRRRTNPDGGFMAATLQGNVVIDPYNDGEYIRWIQQQLRPVPIKQAVQHMDAFRELPTIADQSYRQHRRS